MKTLAIFDLDNTLLGGDSDHAWGEFMVEKKLVDADYYRQQNDYFYQQYQQGIMDIHEFLDFSLKPLSEHSPATLQSLHEEFMQQVIKPIMLPKARALLDFHRQQQHFLLIITATNRFITAPIAALLQVDDLIATEPEQQDGRYTGKVKGTPCFQTGKITRLKAWLKNKPYTLEGSYFYSDSINDLPLLKLVANPVAVDPDEKLASYAKDNDWPIKSLR